jgi:hypothetical protein
MLEKLTQKHWVEILDSSTKEHDDSISELEVSADINPPTSSKHF